MEIIDSVCYEQADLAGADEALVGEIFEQLKSFVSSGSAVCLRRPSLLLAGDEFRPEIAVVSSADVKDETITTPPALIVEIATPQNAFTVYASKYAKYLSAGVEEYWVVNRQGAYTLTASSDSVFVHRYRARYNASIPVGSLYGCIVDMQTAYEKAAGVRG